MPTNALSCHGTFCSGTIVVIQQWHNALGMHYCRMHWARSSQEEKDSILP